jgi:hypothetical protein
MNHFEYSIDVIVNEDVEKKTTEIIDMVKLGRSPFNLYKIIDEPGNDDKDPKKRTFIILSYSNIHTYIYQLFYGTAAKINCCFKTFVQV